MIYSAGATPKDLDLLADVCVVGSGVGGSVIAREMAERGLRAVVLEEGGYCTKEQFTQAEREMLPKLYKEQGGQATVDQAVAVLQGRCVGGTTVVNYLCCFKTPDRVLREWAERGVVGMKRAAEVYLAAGAKEVYTCHAKRTVIQRKKNLDLIDQRGREPVDRLPSLHDVPG